MKTTLSAMILSALAATTAAAQNQGLTSSAEVTLSTLAPHVLDKDLSAQQIRELNSAVEDGSGADLLDIQRIVGH